MAHFIGCCCAECSGTAAGCSEADSGVTGGICAASDAMVTTWEIEIEGLQVNTNWCDQSAECDTCYKPEGSGSGEGSENCLQPYGGFAPFARPCYGHSLTDLNGLYLHTSYSYSGCSTVQLLLTQSNDDTYQCASCAGGTSATCYYLAFLFSQLDLRDHSSDADYPGPVGAKMFLYSLFPASPDGGSSEAANLYFLNDTFRACNPTLNCTSRNVWENEITEPSPISITTGSLAPGVVIPRYYGGTITMRPICT
jgi:hypothetical protein